MARGGTLVLGGGFAGSYVARQLGDSGATIVNPTNFMLYTPLLPEAAAGSVEPRHVTVPLRTMCPHSDLVLGSAAELDTRRRVVVRPAGLAARRLRRSAQRGDPGQTDPATCQHALRQARRLAEDLRGTPAPTATAPEARWPRSAAATASP